MAQNGTKMASTWPPESSKNDALASAPFIFLKNCFLSAMMVREQRSAEGKTKKYVMFGDVSDYFAVMAKHNESLKMILLSKDTKGLDVKETTSLDQTRPMCEISMSDIKIHDDYIMFESSETLKVWEKVKNIALSFLAMEQVGGSQACLDMSTTYAKERIQFGRPIGSFQAIQHICANMLLQLESAKSVAYSAVRTDLSDGLEMEMSSLIAKSYCSEVFNKLAGDNIQVHGGIGFTWDHPAHIQSWRPARRSYRPSFVRFRYPGRHSLPMKNIPMSLILLFFPYR